MTIWARDLNTGMAKWVYQMTPHDEWDFDGVTEMVLADLQIKGKQTPVVMHRDRNGFGYTLNRETGELLVVENFDPNVNWASKVDMKSGRPVVSAKYSPGTTGPDVDVKDICPAALGSKDEQPSSFDPKSGLLYVPTNHVCMTYEPFQIEYTAGQPYVGATLTMYPTPNSHGGMGNFIARDPTQGKIVWSKAERISVWSGALTTAVGRAVRLPQRPIRRQHQTRPSISTQPMTRRPMRAVHGAAAMTACVLALATLPAAADQADGVLKVCADPANLPLSNDKGEGYENKIAEALARDLKLRVAYTFFPQRMGFVRNTLRSKDEQTQQYKCDLIIGVPTQYELTATTQPYMRSTYSLIFASRGDLDSLRTADDLLQLSPEKLSALRIGVFTRLPGVDWLLRHGLMEHAAVYSHQNGDIDESPARTIERDLAASKIDAAILWGPIAGKHE